MIISRIEARNFGKFDKLSIVLDEGFNAIFGENEAGKTTVREMIRVLLFGFGKKVKSSKKYAFYPWYYKGDPPILTISCSGTLGDGREFSVTRSLASSVTGSVSLGGVETDIGNEPLSFVGHLSEELYRDVYALTTENSIDFQNINLAQLERRVLETWGSSQIRTPEDVTDDLDEEIQAIYRPRYNANTKLRAIDSAITSLRERRSQIIDFRREYSDVLRSIADYTGLIADKSAKLAGIKARMASVEAFMPIFIEEGRTDGIGSFSSEYDFERFTELSRDKAEKLFSLASEIRACNDELRASDSVASSTSDDIYSMWHGLFNSFPQDALLDQASNMSFSESVMVAREGRALKMALSQKGGFRRVVSLIMGLAGGSAIASYYLANDMWPKMDSTTLMLSLGAAGIIGILGAASFFDTAISRFSIKRRLKRITNDTFDLLADFSPPQKAVETFDEEWFRRLTLVEELCKKLKSHEKKSADASHRKELLTREFGVISGIDYETCDMNIGDILDDLKGYLSREKHVRRRQNEIEGAIRRAESATALSIDDVRNNIMGSYPGLEPLEVLEAIRREHDEVVERMNEYNVEVARLKGLVKNDESLEELIDIESKIKSLKEESEEHRARLAKLTMLKEFLFLANEKFIGDKKPDFTRRASEAFSRITGGRYSDIVIREDESIHARNASGDDHLEWNRISSTATREQLFMSLKLAVLEDVEKKHESLPVSLDETFSHWDDKRIGRFLELLGKGYMDRQYIFYTCDRSMLDIISDRTSANVIFLREDNRSAL